MKEKDSLEDLHVVRMTMQKNWPEISFIGRRGINKRRSGKEKLGSYEYGNEHAVSIGCEGLPGWLINYLILQHDYAMKIQSNFRLITIHLFFNNIYVTLCSSTCFEQHAVHHQEDKLYHHSLWYRHPL
jgi:hypothetical protein